MKRIVIVVFSFTLSIILSIEFTIDSASHQRVSPTQINLPSLSHCPSSTDVTADQSMKSKKTKKEDWFRSFTARVSD